MNRLMSAIHGSNSLGRYPEKPFGPPAAFRRGLAYSGFNVTFRLQTVERGVNRADGYFPPGPQFDLLTHGNPVGTIAQTHKRQDHDMFEFAKEILTAHNLYNIELRLSGQGQS